MVISSMLLKMAGFITQVRRVWCSATLDVALWQEAPCLLRVAAVFYSMGAMEGARTLVEEAHRGGGSLGGASCIVSGRFGTHWMNVKRHFSGGKKLTVASWFTFFVLPLCIYLTCLTLCNTWSLLCLLCTGCGWILQFSRSGAEWHILDLCFHLFSLT